MSDQELLDLAGRELAAIGLGKPDEIEDGTVSRMPKAYPVYDSTYKEALSTIRKFLEPLRNLQLIGRNGMHKYNNQDHSMLTAMLAVENILGANHNIWDVNAAGSYHEEVSESEANDDLRLCDTTQPHVPTRLKEPVCL
jgi:hypothetical protein